MEGADDLALRATTLADESFLERVYASTRAEELALTNWTDEQKKEFCRMQFVAQDTYYKQHYANARFDVIQRGGVDVGRLYVERGPEEIRIIDISLLPEFRGQGTGTKFLRELQQEARSAGKRLSIHVEKFNRALHLYQRLGFQPVKDQGVYLLMEWTGQ